MSSDEETFFLKKMKTLFTRFDIDGSGQLEESDFDQWSDRLLALGNLNADQSAKLKQSIRDDVWKKNFSVAGADGKVSLSDFLEHAKKNCGSGFFQDTLPLIYEAIDTDKDDSISENEFANFFKSLNVPDEKCAHEVFRAMDVNGDKTLSKTEFCDFGKSFFTNKDQTSPTRLFFGPLVD